VYFFAICILIILYTFTNNKTNKIEKTINSKYIILPLEFTKIKKSFFTDSINSKREDI